jgi:hypothetical protein
MRIRHVRPAVLQVTLHAYELTALIAAARWAVAGAPGEMSAEARDQLRTVLENYDTGLARQESGQEA